MDEHEHQRAATGYSPASWPIAAGAWWDGTRYRCAEPSCQIVGLHIAGPPTPSRARPARIGRRSPAHTALLQTGLGIDAIELPARATAAVTAARKRFQPPAIARLPTGRWLLFTTTDDSPTDFNPVNATGTDTALTRSAHIDGAGSSKPVHHGQGSFVPLPPSRLAVGPVRWHRRPWAGELPPATAILRLVAPLLASFAALPQPLPRHEAHQLAVATRASV